MLQVSDTSKIVEFKSPESTFFYGRVRLASMYRTICLKNDRN